MVDSLSISASSFKIPIPIKLKYEVEVRFRPRIPNNVKLWNFFENDQEIIRFIEVVEEFFVLNIDQDEYLMKDDVYLQDTKNLQKQSADQLIIQLPTNHIPKGLISLEKLFDQNYVSFNNLATGKEPRYVKLSKALSKEIKAEYHKMFYEFVDVFS